MSRRRRTSVSLVLAAILVLAPASSASARIYEIPPALGQSLDLVREVTGLDILLPGAMAFDFDGATYAAGVAGQDSYSLSLAGAPNCGGATACFLALFSARAGTHPDFGRKVKLRGGRKGYFKALNCGGSCSSPAIEWVTHGTVYSIQANVPDTNALGQQRRLIRAANSAIIGGPR